MLHHCEANDTTLMAAVVGIPLFSTHTSVGDQSSSKSQPPRDIQQCVNINKTKHQWLKCNEGARKWGGKLFIATAVEVNAMGHRIR